MRVNVLEESKSNISCSYNVPLSDDIVDQIITIQRLCSLGNNFQNYQGTGFLVTCFDPKELYELSQKGSYFIFSSIDNKLMSFLLLTDFRIFLEQVKAGHYEGELEKYSEGLYLYQLAVRPDKRNTGIGKKLIEYAKLISKKGLLADILVSPHKNELSLQFFSRRGFRTVGLLKLGNYRDFGELTAQVVHWDNAR